MPISHDTPIRAFAHQCRAAPARFGPAPHNAWTLAGGRVSLVRGPRPRPVQMPAEPQPIEFDLARSALVVVDMQNDFCHPEGWFAQKGIGIRAARKPIAAIAAAAAGVARGRRRRGVAQLGHPRGPR
jgi:hypothetical protein